jgi:DNA-binding transcriptional LysR family regulator
MPDVRAVNLNLLLVLDALLETRSVTRAGERLGLTQSGTSNALAELRRVLGDPLFVRQGSQMRPTPRALALAPHVRSGIVSLQAALAEPRFDPATARRKFVLAAPDLVQLALLPPLVRELSQQAPGIELAVRTWPGQRVPDGLLTGEIDLFAGFVDHIPQGCGTAVLFDDHYVCLLRPGHPAAADLTLERWLALDHVVVTDDPEGTTSIDRLLADQGLRRRIALRVQSFLLVPALIAVSDLVASVDSRLAAPALARGEVVGLPPPLRLPRGRVRLLWAQQAEADPALVWLKALALRSLHQEGHHEQPRPPEQQ